MLTLGVDLATEPKKTGACLIDWGRGSARVAFVVVGTTDSDLTDAIAAADWTGIDAPFGWPTGFVRAMVDYAERRVWPGDNRAPLRLRETDRCVRERTGLTPMSVSTDRIGSTAMRCASLLTKVAEQRERPLDLVGRDRVVEVYPAAALKRWATDASDSGLVSKGYKGNGGSVSRSRILSALARLVRPLKIADGYADLCRRNDDALDALVCALIARAAALGLTWEPIEQQLRTARDEGWIHVPKPHSLTQLIG